MNLENIYNSNKDSIIGFNQDNFNNYRKKGKDANKKCVVVNKNLFKKY